MRLVNSNLNTWKHMRSTAGSSGHRIGRVGRRGVSPSRCRRIGRQFFRRCSHVHNGCLVVVAMNGMFSQRSAGWAIHVSKPALVMETCGATCERMRTTPGKILIAVENGRPHLETACLAHKRILKDRRDGQGAVCFRSVCATHSCWSRALSYIFKWTVWRTPNVAVMKDAKRSGLQRGDTGHIDISQSFPPWEL